MLVIIIIVAVEVLKPRRRPAGYLKTLSPGLTTSSYNIIDIMFILSFSNSPSSSREDPPPYPLPEHSILKSHLVRARPAQQWTISKKEGEYQEQVLYTNEHIQGVRSDDPAYGPGKFLTDFSKINAKG